MIIRSGQARREGPPWLRCTSSVLARGADMLLCMCWDGQECMVQSGENVGQCGTIGAAEMAREAGVKKLVLVHVGPHLAAHGPMEKGIGDVGKIFDGEIIFAEELMSLHL
jgi:ribonuclease BN (tRNA processing enzyme)